VRINKVRNETDQ